MDKYKKLKVVGKGSFGYALLVQALSNKKQYIVKIIDISKMDRKQREEALNEVHVLKAMRHPYIITYRESFMEKKCLCIVMDYADGGDLYAKIARQKEIGQLFTEEQVLDWFVQMALAMNHIHERKILHRDLKTQNIFLTSKSDVKIGDFGIARVLQHTYDCAKTAIGTPYYLSPEICQEKPYNQKSDIWSLGCILYELTTLNHAFDAMSMKELVLKILRGTYPPIPAQYSTDLQGLIFDMLTKDPSKRPSIKKILEKEFLKARISNLLVSTLNRHELSELNDKHPQDIVNQKSVINLMQQQSIEQPQQPLQSIFSSQNASPITQRQVNKKSSPSKKPEISKHISVKSYSPCILQDDQNHNQMSKVLEEKSTNISNTNHTTNHTTTNNSNNNSQRPSIVQKLSVGHKENSFSKLTNMELLSKLSNKQQKQPEMKKGQVFMKKEEEDSFDSQGYGYLLKDIKRCLDKRQSKQEEDETMIVDNFSINPSFLNKQIAVPGVTERDSIGYKIEALRFYLEQQVGLEQFMQAYQIIEQCQESESIKLVNQLLNPDQRKYVPLIFQLIVCEDSYY